MTPFPKTAALDSAKAFCVVFSQCGSTEIYLLPARHAGNGLGRGYLFL
jgi:hypothetical protein